MQDTSGLIDLIAQLMTAGGFGGLVWYLIVKELPRITDKFTAALTLLDDRYEKIQKQFADEMKIMREAYQVQVTASRDLYYTELVSQRKQFSEQLEKQQEYFNQELKKLFDKIVLREYPKTN